MSERPLSANLSLRQLRAFHLVEREGSMTRAASHMHLTISALSMLIRSLEDELGVRLFERSTRRMELSEAGRLFSPCVARVLEALDDGVHVLHKHQQAHAARLTLATSPLLAATLMPQVIAEFRAQCPQVQVELVDVPVDQVAQHVREGRVELGICTRDASADDLHAERIYQDALVLACPADHALAQRHEVGWQELDTQPLILLMPGSGLRRLVDGALQRAGVTPRVAFEVANVQTAAALVGSGLGLAALPAYACERSANTRVVAVPLVRPVVQREVVALCVRGHVWSQVAGMLLDHFRRATDGRR